LSSAQFWIRLGDSFLAQSKGCKLLSLAISSYMITLGTEAAKAFGRAVTVDEETAAALGVVWSFAEAALPVPPFFQENKLKLAEKHSKADQGPALATTDLSALFPRGAAPSCSIFLMDL
jgi:hypothetical protein